MPRQACPIYAIDPTASGEGFHPCYEGVAGVILADHPQLPAVNSVHSDGSPALTGHCLVERMPQPDLHSAEEHFVASRLQVLPLVEVAGLEPGDILGVAHGPLRPAGRFKSRPPSSQPSLRTL